MIRQWYRDIRWKIKFIMEEWEKWENLKEKFGLFWELMSETFCDFFGIKEKVWDIVERPDHYQKGYYSWDDAKKYVKVRKKVPINIQGLPENVFITEEDEDDHKMGYYFGNVRSGQHKGKRVRFHWRDVLRGKKEDYYKIPPQEWDKSEDSFDDEDIDEENVSESYQQA